MKTITTALLFCTCVLTTSSYAGIFNVTNLNFSGPGSLQQAIDFSNESLDPSQISFEVSGTIPLETELPRILSPITINGGQQITLDGQGSTRIFRVGADANVSGSGALGQLTLNGLTLQNALVTPSSSALDRNPLTSGGGVFLERGTLTVENSTFRENIAGNGAAIYALGGEGNQLTIENTTFSGNDARSSFGGAVFVDSDQSWDPDGVQVSINNSTFDSNAGAFGGGFAVRDNDRGSGSFSVTNSQFTGNRANGGGAFYNRETTILIDNVVMDDNAASLQTTGFNRGGGAIYFSNLSSATIRNSSITGNDADFAGAIAIFNGGNIQIEDSTIAGNNALEQDDVRGGDGGGIYILGGVDGASVRLLRSTVQNNHAVNGSGGGILSADAGVEVIESLIADNTAGSSGGGIYVDRVNGRLLMQNSTVTGNSTTGLLDNVLVEAGRGGGIYFITGQATIDSSTIADNSATEQGGGILIGGNPNPNGLSTVLNSIFSNNTAPLGPTVQSTEAVLDSLGFNLLTDDGSGLFDEISDLLNAFADLQPLADNGGPTFTRALGEESLAIDNGFTSLLVDQRGLLRPVGAAADIGAFEVPEPTSLALLVIGSVVTAWRRNSWRSFKTLAGRRS